MIPAGIPLGITLDVLAGFLPSSFSKILPEMPLVILLGIFLKTNSQAVDVLSCCVTEFIPAEYIRDFLKYSGETIAGIAFRL